MFDIIKYLLFLSLSLVLHDLPDEALIRCANGGRRRSRLGTSGRGLDRGMRAIAGGPVRRCRSLGPGGRIGYSRNVLETAQPVGGASTKGPGWRLVHIRPARAFDPPCRPARPVSSTRITGDTEAGGRDFASNVRRAGPDQEHSGNSTGASTPDGRRKWTRARSPDRASREEVRESTAIHSRPRRGI